MRDLFSPYLLCTYVCVCHASGMLSSLRQTIQQALCTFGACELRVNDSLCSAMVGLRRWACSYTKAGEQQHTRRLQPHDNIQNYHAMCTLHAVLPGLLIYPKSTDLLLWMDGPNSTDFLFTCTSPTASKKSLVLPPFQLCNCTVPTFCIYLFHI